MRNWPREFARNFKGGVDKAYGMDDVNIQMNLLTERLSDKSITDEVLVDDVFSFLHKFPEQRNMQNFQAILSRIMNQRPGTIELIQKIIGK
jgi:hypothetical protein